MKAQCIQAVAQAIGRAVTGAEAKGMEERIVRNMRSLARKDPATWAGLSQAERLQQSALLAGQELIGESKLKQQRVALTVMAHDRIQRQVTAQAAAGISGLDALDRMVAFHADLKSNFLSVESQANAVRDDALRQMLGTLEASNPKWFGLLENKEGVRAIIKEIFGESTGVKEAADGAKQWHEVATLLKERFNRSGGDIGDLEDWGLPHHHSQSAVAKAGRDAWVQDLLPMLDRDHYYNPDGTRMDAAQLTEFLGHAWTTIATGGANKVEPGKFSGGGARANRGSESRQVHFKDADSYIAYQEKYGERSLYEVLIGHIENVSKDIALVETFGPNPDHAFRFFRDKLLRDAKLADPIQTGKLDERATKTDALYNIVAGKSQPVASEFLAKSFDTLRNWLVAARLGSSVITSFSDDATLHLTSKLNNLPAMQTLANELATLNPANKMEERLAQRAGLGLRTLVSSLNRFGQGPMRSGFSKSLAGATLRASGLNALTEARRRAFGVTMMGSIGSVAKEHGSLKDIDPTDYKVLLSKGVTETDFQVWKKAQLEDWGDGNDTMLTPEAIYRIPDADIDTVIAPQIAKLKADAQAQITELQARSAQDQQWAGNRAASLSQWLTDAQAKVTKRIGQVEGDTKVKLQELHGSLVKMYDRIDTAKSFYRQAKTNQSSLGELRRLAKSEGRSERTLAEAKSALQGIAKDAESLQREMAEDFEIKWVAKEQDLLQRVERGDLSERELQPAFDRFEQLFTEANARLTERSAQKDSIAAKRAKAGGARLAKIQAILEELDDAWTAAAGSRQSIGDIRREAVREGASTQAATQLKSDVRDIKRQLEGFKTGLLDDLWDKFQGRQEEVTEFAKRVAERDKRRTHVIDRITKEVDPAIANARTRAREQAATKLLGAVLEETDVAVIEPGAKERVITGAGLQRGTWKGELTRSFFLFKSFPLAMIARHWERGMSLPNAGGRAAYLGTLLAATTVLGMASMQVNEVLSGRDPKNLNPFGKGGTRNWIQALLKGGSLGIYGDFLFSEATQHGQSPIASLTGPVFGLVESAFNLTQGNAMQFARGEDTHLGAEVVKFAKGNTPAQSLWYAKAAFDHLIWNQLAEYFSPGYLAKLRQRSEREFGQKYYWSPEDVAPDRAPDVGATFQ